MQSAAIARPVGLVVAYGAVRREKVAQCFDAPAFGAHAWSWSNLVRADDAELQGDAAFCVDAAASNSACVGPQAVRAKRSGYGDQIAICVNAATGGRTAGLGSISTDRTLQNGNIACGEY